MLSRAAVPCHSIIRAIHYLDHRAQNIVPKFVKEEISNLNDLVAVLSVLSSGAQVTLEYLDLHSRRSESVLVTADKPEWYPAPQIYTRDYSVGLWETRLACPDKSMYTKYYKPPERDLTTSPPGHVGDQGGAPASASVVELVIQRINPSLVAFEVHYPLKCMIDGMESRHSSGTGVIVYHCESWGLVAIDKVPMSACDVMLSFAAFPIPKQIPGEVVFLHPVHNYSLVAYDHSSLGEDASLVCVAEIVPVTRPGLKEGDRVYLVGLSGDSQQAVSVISTVTSSEGVIEIATDRFAKAFIRFSGVLSDEHGFVHAIWGRFGNTHDQGIPTYGVNEVAKTITHGNRGSLVKGIKRPLPLLRILGVEFCSLSLFKAQKFGLSKNWVKALKEKNPIRCQVLYVESFLARSQARDQLQKDDMILAINGDPITCHQDIAKACQGLDEVGDDTLKMTIFRQLQPIEVTVGTDLLDGSGTTRLVSWCGYFIEERPREVHALDGVYVKGLCKGSPAKMFCSSAEKILSITQFPNLKKKKKKKHKLLIWMLFCW